MVREQFPAVKIVQNESNVGLGRAQNQGIESTEGRYVLLLNDDTLVNGASLDAMVEFLDLHPDVGAVGGRLLNADGSFQAGLCEVLESLGGISYRDTVGRPDLAGLSFAWRC